MATTVQEQVQVVYNREARRYDFVFHTLTLGLEPRLRRRLGKRLRLQADDIVLDLACGTGLNFPFIEQGIGPNGQIIAVDISSEMLARAHDRVVTHGWKNVTLFQADVLAFRPTVPVDVALCTFAIGLMPEPTALAQAMVTMVRPGGQVLISDGRLIDRWYRFPLNPLLHRLGRPWIPPSLDKGYWSARPWEALSVLLDEFHYEEWLGGSVYVAWGRRGTGLSDQAFPETGR